MLICVHGLPPAHSLLLNCDAHILSYTGDGPRALSGALDSIGSVGCGGQPNLTQPRHDHEHPFSNRCFWLVLFSAAAVGGDGSDRGTSRRGRSGSVQDLSLLHPIALIWQLHLVTSRAPSLVLTAAAAYSSLLSCSHSLRSKRISNTVGMSAGCPPESPLMRGRAGSIPLDTAQVAGRFLHALFESTSV